MGGVVHRRATGRKLLSLGLGLTVIVVAYERGLIGDVSLTALVAAVIGATVVSNFAARTFPPGGSQRDVHLRTATLGVPGVSPVEE